MNERTALIYVIKTERGLGPNDFGCDRWDDVSTSDMSKFVFGLPKDVAVPQDNLYVPIGEYELDGEKWMHFMYRDSDPEPWNWPKVMEYKGLKYMFTGYNSDTHHVYYKEVKHVATGGGL